MCWALAAMLGPDLAPTSVPLKEVGESGKASSTRTLSAMRRREASDDTSGSPSLAGSVLPV